MDVLAALGALLLLAVVIAIVSRPLVVARRDADHAATRRSELEAQREAKLQEIRDTELDFRTGKLTQADFEAIDGSLRAEALEILRQLDAPDSAPAD
jgi:type II secretory pathway component PulM